MTYDVDYFIHKFEAIPRHQWCTGVYKTDDGKCCVDGHCGQPTTTSGYTRQCLALQQLIYSHFRVCSTEINDGASVRIPGITGKHPRTRILQALRIIKRRQETK